MYGTKTKQYSVCRIVNQTGAIPKDHTCNINWREVVDLWNPH